MSYNGEYKNEFIANTFLRKTTTTTTTETHFRGIQMWRIRTALLPKLSSKIILRIFWVPGNMDVTNRECCAPFPYVLLTGGATKWKVRGRDRDMTSSLFDSSSLLLFFRNPVPQLTIDLHWQTYLHDPVSWKSRL